MKAGKSSTISEAEAKENLEDLISKAKNNMERYILTRNGKPEAILMSYEDYQEWSETIEMLSNPEEVQEILETSKEMDEGNYSTYEEVFGEPLPKK